MLIELKVYITYLNQDKGTRMCELEKRFSEYPTTKVYRAAKHKIGSAVEDKSHTDKGQPCSLFQKVITLMTKVLNFYKKIKKSLYQRMLHTNLMFISNCKEIPPRKKYDYFQCQKK